ncbi:MAG: NAD(P)/FAD-dependent oxidoreductase [Candidatus Brocadiia bacterium]
MKTCPYLIIGNSVTAVGAVRGIREHDSENAITVVSREPHHTYSRPLISYLLAGKVAEGDMFYCPENYCEKNQIEPVLNVEAKKVDSDEHSVALENGENMSYDQLLIATGGSPIVPAELAGTDAEGVFTFTTWQDAREIDRWIENRSVERAVAVGAGLIGLKSMEALVERGIQTTVVELADRVLGSTFDGPASRLAANQMRDAGVDVRCGTTVRKIKQENGRISGVELQGGEPVKSELLVFAIGVRPNVGLVQNAGVKIGDGIIVDGRMRTTAPDIYAAGDVAEAQQRLSDGYGTLPIFPDAHRQGHVAGVNMAGGEENYAGGLAMNSVDVFGLPTISVGLTNPESDEFEILQLADEADKSYRKIVLKDNRVVGAIFIGCIDRAGIVTGLIREEVDVSDFKEHLLTDDFGLVSLPKDYRKHVVSGLGIEV